MRVLVDEYLPRQLRQWLPEVRPDWNVVTVQDAGWASMRNGALLRAANDRFDVLLTADKNMLHQQNLAPLNIALLVFPTNRAKVVRAGVLALVQSLSRVRPGEATIMDLAGVADWNSAKLVDAAFEEGIARHIFGP